MSPPEGLKINARLAPLVGSLDPGDVDAIRLLLRGNSVIDWNRAHFSSRADVDRFLRLHLLDPDAPEDQRRLRFVHGEAIHYLSEHLDLHFPDDLANPEDVRDIFVQASATGGFRRRQILSCVILKLMHVVNHMEAAELRHQTPLPEAAIMDQAERRIVAAADRMRAEGFPLVAFYGSRKTRNSVITKLLAKKENTAATVFDKLRFRLVTESHEHILPALQWLTRELFPFNYVIPGQSHNNLVNYEEAVEALRDANSQAPDAEPTEPDAKNPFSGGSYRMINFIVDFPVRVDHLVQDRYGPMLGRTVFALVEFQVLDRATAQANEEGENAHSLYKERQRAIVGQRLKRGRRRRTES